MKKILSILLMAAILPTFAFANNLDSMFEDSQIFEEDSIFENEDLFEDNSLFETENTGTASNLNLADDLLTSEATLSGSYSFNFKTGLNYDLDTNDEPDFFSTSAISTELALSARPTTDSRFFAKTSLTYPFENVSDDDSTPTNEEYNFFKVDELFYDFILGEDYFTRVGKQTLNMGVGYFYSPANLLNISNINPLAPEDDQEGPLAIKINKPIGNDNLYAYITLPSTAEYEPTDLSYAAKIEKVIDNGEYSLSGVYSYDIANSPAKIAATASTSLFTDIDVFAEAVESYDGSTFYFSGTAGIQILKNIEDLLDTSVSLTAQYYYNQDGISYYGPVTYDATHQLAAMLSISLPNDISVSLLSINVLSQESGVVVGNLWYNMDDNLSINLGTTYSYGAKNSIQPYIGITLGKGDF